MSAYLELYNSFKSAYTNDAKKNFIKKFYKKLVLDKSNGDFIVILLRIFKESNEDLAKIINAKNLIDYYTKTYHQENKDFIIQELKERNFNTDNLIFA